MPKDLFSIEGKIALVTGGSRGIGEMIAAGFLASGGKVYISSRKADVWSSCVRYCTKTCRRPVPMGDPTSAIGPGSQIRMTMSGR